MVPDGAIYSVPHLLIFVGLWVVLQYGWAALLQPDVFQGAQIDTDGYMRLVRVELLLEHGAWFDGSFPRSNWPYGESSHWTRPLDVLILAIALPVRLFLDWPGALAVAGALVSPLCHLALCVAAPWIVAPLVPGEERSLAMPAMLAQPVLLSYGTPGRADHHALILLISALALGAWLRVMLDPGRTRAAWGAGALSGAAIWVSPEALLPLAILFATGGWAWVLRGSEMMRANRRLCGGLVLTFVLALVIERPPLQWFLLVYDQVSIVHLTLALLALSFWLAAEVIPGLQHDGPRPALTRIRRVAFAIAGLAVTAALMAAIHPNFFAGPWADVDPKIIGMWLQWVHELQPVYPRRIADIGDAVMLLGPALLLAPAAFLWVRRERDEGRRLVWLLLSVSLLVYVPLGAWQRRFLGLASIIFAILMVELLRRIRQESHGMRPACGAALRVVGVAGLMTVFCVAGLLASRLAGGMQPDESAAEQPSRIEAAACALPAMADVLNQPGRLGAEPLTIAAFIDFGPELLYRTPHRVLAGPYHRNSHGIIDSYRLLTSSDDAAIRTLAQERDVNLIVICPPLDGGYFGRGGTGSLYQRLVDGTPPSWIRPIALPPTVPSGFRLFEVQEL